MEHTVKRVPSFIESEFKTRSEYDTWVKQQNDDDEDDEATALPPRTQTDLNSGLEFTPNLERFPGIPEAVLRRHFEDFQALDVSESGFIDASDLTSISKALGHEIAEEMTLKLIQEVYVLLGKKDDGKLTFRDYIALNQYEEEVTSNNAAIDAAEEAAAILNEEVAERAAPSADAPQLVSKRSSLDVLRAATSKVVAMNRLRSSGFAQLKNVALKQRMMWEEKAEHARKTSGVGPSPPTGTKVFDVQGSVGAEGIELLGVAAKAKLFLLEQGRLAKEGVPEMSVRWRTASHGRYERKKVFAQPPPPMIDLTK